MNFLKFIKHLFILLLTFLLGAQTTYAKTEFVLPQNQVSFSIEQTQSFQSLEKEVQPNIGFFKEKSKFVTSKGVSARNQHEFSESFSYYLANAVDDVLLASLKTKFTGKTKVLSWLDEVTDNSILTKLNNWHIDEVTRLESHLGKYSDLAGELSNPNLFDAVETIVKNPENAWDALRDLKNADIVSETINRIGKSSFFTDVIGKGRVFEQSVLDNIVQGFTSKSGTAYNAVKTQIATLGKNIDDYVLFKQVQFDVPGGKMISDQVLVKYDFAGEIDDIIILENKLKSSTGYTTRQTSGWKEIHTGNKLTVRSVSASSFANSSSAKSLTQGTELTISNVIRVDGGTTGQLNSVQATIENLSNF